MPLNRSATKMPKLGEDWKTQPENIDPRTGKPMKRRAARVQLADARPAAMGSGSTNIPGQSTQGLAPGTSPATSPAGGLRSGGTTLPNTPPGGGVSGTGGIVNQSTVGGPLGTLQPHGQIIAAEDPTSMWGQMLPGGSGSRAAGFYAGMFPTESMGVAAGLGGGMQTNQDYLSIGAELAREFAGGAGAGKFLDPVTMMKNIFTYASGITEQGSFQGQGAVGPLAGLADMTPPDALNAFISIVEGALGSTMPRDMAAAYSSMLQRIGQQYIDQWMQQPFEQEGQTGMSVVKYIMQKLGPNLGLAAGGQGGMGTTQAQVAGAF